MNWKRISLTLTTSIGIAVLSGCSKSDPETPKPDSDSPAASSMEQMVNDAGNAASAAAAEVQQGAETATERAGSIVDSAVEEANVIKEKMSEQAAEVAAKFRESMAEAQKLIAESKPREAMQKLGTLSTQPLTEDQKAKVQALMADAKKAMADVSDKAKNAIDGALGGSNPLKP